MSAVKPYNQQKREVVSAARYLVRVIPAASEFYKAGLFNIQGVYDVRFRS